MNSSMRNITLALLIAFAGAQVNSAHAMVTDSVTLTAEQYNALKQAAVTNFVQPLQAISTTEAQELANAVATDSDAQNWLTKNWGKFCNGLQVVSAFPVSLIAKYPKLSVCGLVLAGAAGSWYLVHKTETGKAGWSKIKSTVLTHPKKVIGGVGAATALAAIYGLHKSGYLPFYIPIANAIAPMTAALSNGLTKIKGLPSAVGNIFSKFTSSLPSWNTAKAIESAKNAMTASNAAKAITAGTIVTGAAIATKKMLAAPAEQELFEQIDGLNLITTPLVKPNGEANANEVARAAKFLSADELLAKREEVQAKREQEANDAEIARKFQEEEFATTQVQNAKALNALVKQQFIALVNSELNFTCPVGTAMKLIGQLDQQRDKELIDTYKAFVLAKSATARKPAVAKLRSLIK